MGGNPGARTGHVPSIIAQLAISFANVLKLFSMSSSFESRESRESCVLHEREVVYSNKLDDPHYSPEARIFCRNKASAHPHDRQKPNLPKVRALSYKR